MGPGPLGCGRLVDLVYSFLDPKLTHCFFWKPFVPGMELCLGNKCRTRQTQLDFVEFTILHIVETHKMC